ncbi:class I SAM-dependent methyltransferase [Jeotgalibacillus marinus]|uniref:Class I SAM-dependent methyltransferase n=1 Tax=Jeotgalibacillus marinus TaxID=86667 RepID=A0ABV3Q1E4_9BACL
MLNKQGFDLWANDYDQTVQVNAENDLYPFAGYKTILNTIFNEVMQKKKSTVLDIGFGTGILTTKLYEHGHRLDGVDFSTQMIAIAQAKMPNAQLIEWDFTNDLPSNVHSKKYDSIVSTYALHHLTDREKISFIQYLLPFLSETGKIFIGDIAFLTRDDLDLCREKNISYWDDDEFYFAFNELYSALKDVCLCEFHPISHCGAVIIISNK